MVTSLIVDAPIIPAKDFCGSSFPEDSIAWVAGAGAGGDEPWKTLTAASAAADAASSIASFRDPCAIDCT